MLAVLFRLLLLLLVPATAGAWTLTDRCELIRETSEGSFAIAAIPNGMLLRLPDELAAGDARVRVEFGGRSWRVRPVGGAVELDGAVEPFLKGNWVTVVAGDDNVAGFNLSGSSAAWDRLKGCDLPPRKGWVTLSGEIDATSDDRIITEIRDRRPEGLVLDSAGGLREEAQRIGNRVRAAGMVTKVEAGTQCLSGCLFVLAAGASRIIEPGARVGLSPSLITEGLGVFDADPGAATDSAVYFTGMGVDGGKMAVLAMSPTSGGMHILTPAEFQSVGLLEAKRPDLANNPLFPQPSESTKGEWIWLLLGLLGLGVLLRSAALRWAGS